MNVAELTKLLKDNEGTDDSWPEIASEMCGSWAGKGEYDGPLIERLNVLGYKIFGEGGYGGEGKGDTYWGVFSVENPQGNKFYFRMSGFYASYNGSDVDYWDFKPVKQVETKTLVWKPL